MLTSLELAGASGDATGGRWSAATWVCGQSGTSSGGLPVCYLSVAPSPLALATLKSQAVNLYHDGSEGLQNHFDDAARFCQPIYSLRVFSDSRLALGGQLYG